MALYVRRISYKWVGKYNLLHFIQDSYAGYPVTHFDNKEEIKRYLRRVLMKEIADTNFIRADVFPDEEFIWLYIVDMELREGYSVKVEFTAGVTLHGVEIRKVW